MVLSFFFQTGDKNWMDDLYIESFFQKETKISRQIAVEESLDPAFEVDSEPTDLLSQMHFYFRPLKNEIKNKLKEQKHIQIQLQKIEHELFSQKHERLFFLLDELEEFLEILSR